MSQDTPGTAPPRRRAPKPPRRPRSRGLRVLKWTLLVLLILVLVLAALVAWIAGTQSGTAFAWSELKGRLPQGIEVASVEGRLIGPLKVRGVVVDTRSMHTSIKAIDLDWRAADLLSATVHVTNLAVRGIDYRAKKNAPPAPKRKSQPYSLPKAVHLPVAVQIDRVAVDDVSAITSPGAKPFVVKRARLVDARLDNAAWRIKSLTGRGPEFDLDAHARLTPNHGYATLLEANATLRLPHYAPARARAKISGKLNDLRLDARVDAPYNVALTGQVKNALKQPAVDLRLGLDDTHTRAIAAGLPKIAVNATMTAQGPTDDLAVTLNTRADSAAYGKAVLRGALHYGPKALTINRLKLTTPGTNGGLSAHGRLALTQGYSANLAVDWSNLQWPLAGKPAYRSPRGRLRVTGPIDDLALTLDARAASAAYGKAALRGALHYSPKALTIDRLALTTPGTKAKLSARGRVALTQGYAMNLAVGWSDLQWPLAGKPAYRSPRGRVRLTGPIDNYKLHTDLAWQVAGQTQGKLSLAGSGSTQAFDLARLKVAGGPGDISGHAKARWAPRLAASVHLAGRGINPGAVVADLPGDFDLNLDATAARKNGVLHVDLASLSANGSLRHQPLHLNAKARYAGDHVNVDTFKLVTGKTTARLAGRFGWAANAKLDGRWAIDSSDLSTLWPSLAGSLTSRGRMTGRVKAPNVRATLQAHHVAAYGSRVAHAGLDARIDWSGASRSRVALTVAGVDAGGQAIKKVTLDAGGTPTSHHIALALDSAIARANVAADGRYNKKTKQWRFTLSRLRAAYQKLAPWHLVAPAAGVVSARSQSIANACLASGSARLCIKGAHDVKASTAHITLSRLAYAYAKTFFPAGLNASGAISGTVEARVPATGAPNIAANLHTTAGKVTMTTAEAGRVDVLDMDPGHIGLSLNADGMNASVDLPLAATGGVRARLGVSAGKAPLTQRPLNGEVHINIAKLDFIQKLSPQVAAFAGHIKGDLNINGSIARPGVRGRLAVVAPRIVLVGPGLNLSGVRLTAVGHGDSIGITAKARSGGGSLDADGKIALNARGQDVDLAIKGDRFQVVNIPEVTAYASPNLRVRVTPSRVDVTGSVTIPKASITPRNLPASGVVTVSSDQVIVTQNHKPAAKAAARAVHANVKVVLGKKVHIEGFGLKANLAGSLRVIQQPGQQPTGTGAINIVNGSYQAYGQSLDIQKGRILFAGGPVSQPGIELRAARYPTKDITVGVQVRGSVESPRVSLFSDPTMEQSEQLSWLLLGRPLDQASGGQSNKVARAALALGSGRGNRALQGLGKKLGLNLGVGSAAGKGGESTAFTVGKYLSPKLYVSYGIGLFEPVSTLSLRYTLSSHWQLQTQSSSLGTGGDIVYSISR